MSCYNSTGPSGPPQNVMVTSVNPSSLNVSWQPPLEIDQNGPITAYLVFYRRSTEISPLTLTIPANTTEVIITGLTAFVEYAVQVASLNANRLGPASNTITRISGEDSK